MKKIFIFIALLLSIAVIFAGCKEEGFDYEKWLKEQQKMEANRPEVWIYDTDDGNMESTFLHYNHLKDEGGEPEKQYRITVFSSAEYDRDAYLKKLQAAIMAGKGPDIFLTADPDLLTDVNKVIEAGAMQPWDEYLADWTDEDYYLQMIEGCRSEDGKIYLLPIEISPYLVVTTKSNLEMYAFSSDDFADAQSTVEAFLRVCQSDAKESGNFSFRHKLPMQMIFPEILGSRDGVSFSQPQLSALLDKFSAYYSTGEFVTSTQKMFYVTLNRILDQNLPADIMTADILLLNIQHLRLSALEKGEDAVEQTMRELQEELVLFPLVDTDGKMCTEIVMYAMIPRNSKAPEVALDMVQTSLYERQLSTNLGYFSVSKGYTDFSMRSYRQEYSIVSEQLEQILNYPMKGYVMNQMLSDIAGKINDGLILGESYDWDELEKKINIYLSE